jgi:uncharacterized protein (TIGR03089 family)
MLQDAGRPRLTWYGPGGERIELSAKTLNNWVSKTANLLTDELDAGPGTRIGLSLPPHWRTVVWLLATWSAGAHAVLVPPAGAVDVLVTDRPGSGVAQVSARSGATLVAVELAALATRFTGELPSGTVDAATEVRLQPDAFDPPQDPDGADPAFTAGGTTLSYAELLPAAATATPATGTAATGTAGTATAGTATARAGIRLLTAAGPDRAVSAYLAPLLAGGSVVLHGTLPDGDVARIAVQEGAVSYSG